MNQPSLAENTVGELATGILPDELQVSHKTRDSKQKKI